MSTGLKSTLRRSAIAFALTCFCGLGPAHAATLDVHVVADGKPLNDAVVYAIPKGAVPSVSKSTPPALMVQEAQQFAPFVLPIQVGTTVQFPNRDPFRHHVYSFSPAKVFELKLYGRGEVEKVTFDKEGAVALGCNIHDNMLAYIYVVNTPFFAKSDAGAGSISLPAGSYEVHVWHPNQRTGGASQVREVTLSATDEAKVEMSVDLKRDRRQRTRGAADEGAY